MNNLKKVDPEIYEAIRCELTRQEEHIELIASENSVSESVLEAQGSVLTNKYAEGYPSKRWYGGCQNVDQAESLAIERAKKLFSAEHANVQAHSGTQANMAAYFALLNPGDAILAMDLACGGHLSHGHPMNFSGKFFNIISYGVSRKTEMLDYQEIENLSRKHKPKMIVAGASAYPRIIDFKKFKEIADKVGAYFMVDMAHIAGLVAGGVHPSPIPYADIVTSTTHKTLRGPRGGLILCKKKYAKKIDTEIFPGIQGGPLMHVIAAKAVALKEADTSEFKECQRETTQNAKIFFSSLKEYGFRIVSDGTDNHLFLVDLSNNNITGKDASNILGSINIIVNKNLIPFDKKSAFVTSGIRIGTPLVTTRGMKEKEIKEIASIINEALKNKNNKDILDKCKTRVKTLTEKYPLYPNLTA